MSCAVETTSVCTAGGGYIGSQQSSQHIHQYATLMSHNKGETAFLAWSHQESFKFVG